MSTLVAWRKEIQDYRAKLDKAEHNLEFFQLHPEAFDAFRTKFDLSIDRFCDILSFLKLSINDGVFTCKIHISATPLMRIELGSNAEFFWDSKEWRWKSLKS